jgi:hypothetical protein
MSVVGPVANQADEQDIQARTQRHQAQEQQVREALVYREYRQAKHLEACAHHLKAADMAQRRGEKASEAKHRNMYELHKRVLGIHKQPGVPAAIRARIAGANIAQNIHGFTAHAADQWVLG